MKSIAQKIMKVYKRTADEMKTKKKHREAKRADNYMKVEQHN